MFRPSDGRKWIRRIGFLILFVVAPPMLCAQQYGWTVLSRPTTTWTLMSLDFVDSVHGWVGGQDSIYRTTDGGRSWQFSIQPYTPNIFEDVSFHDSLVGWTVGRAFLWRSTNGGQSWQEQLSPFDHYFVGTATLTSRKNITVGYIHPSQGADSAVILRTSDGGNSWKEQILESGTQFYQVRFIDSLTGWITGIKDPFVTRVGIFLRSQDGGQSWQRVDLPQALYVMCFIDSSNGWGVDVNGTFHRTRDGGLVWDSLSRVPNLMDSFSPRSIFFLDSLDGWVFGSAADSGIITEAIYRTTDGGMNWTRESIGLTSDFGEAEDGFMLSRQKGWAACGDGRVLSYGVVGAVVERLPDLPSGFSLGQNYPNPFNGETTIGFELSRSDEISLAIHDVTGRLVATIADGFFSPGVYSVHYNSGSLSSGVYFFSLRGRQEKRQLTHVMTIVK